MLYLDNAATTKINKEVLAAMIDAFDVYGNTEAKFYLQAENAKKMVANARSQVGHIINSSNSNEIIFTSGATEANNLVLRGSVEASSIKKGKIIISAIEHSSIYDTCLNLQKHGVDIDIVPVDATGQVDLQELEKLIDDATILVSIIAVNNEIGTIQDLKAIDNICVKKGVVWHTDATQAIGKIKIDVQQFESLKFLTFTSHKIYGPKGIGCLYVRNDINGLKTGITPLLYGGEQEENLRAGTLSNELIVGFGKACEIAERDFEINQGRLITYENIIQKKLINKFGSNYTLNNDFPKRIPGLLNVRLCGYNNVVLLKAISPIIAASTGSACAVSKPSRVLKAVGLSDDAISESLRLSCSPYLEEKDLDEIDKL